MRALDVDDVARTVVWLDELPPSVVLPEIELRATESGPFAPEPVVPPAAKANAASSSTVKGSGARELL
jgi:hypothetical protein